MLAVFLALSAQVTPCWETPKSHAECNALVEKLYQDVRGHATWFVSASGMNNSAGGSLHLKNLLAYRNAGDKPLLSYTSWIEGAVYKNVVSDGANCYALDGVTNTYSVLQPTEFWNQVRAGSAFHVRAMADFFESAITGKRATDWELMQPNKKLQVFLKDGMLNVLTSPDFMPYLDSQLFMVAWKSNAPNLTKDHLDYMAYQSHLGGYPSNWRADFHPDESAPGVDFRFRPGSAKQISGAGE